MTVRQTKRRRNCSSQTKNEHFPADSLSDEWTDPPPTCRPGFGGACTAEWARRSGRRSRNTRSQGTRDIKVDRRPTSLPRRRHTRRRFNGVATRRTIAKSRRGLESGDRTIRATGGRRLAVEPHKDRPCSISAGTPRREHKGRTPRATKTCRTLCIVIG